MGIFNMRFQLLFLSAFVALASARGTEKPAKHPYGYPCTEPGIPCPCTCMPHQTCPPCPIPVPAACLETCGDTLCPCLTTRDVKKTRSNQGLIPPWVVMAQALSTVNVYPSGPVCSGFHILPHLVVTSSSCIAGKTRKELFVTVNQELTVRGYATKGDHYEPLNVKAIEVYPYSSTYAQPVLLVLERPTFKVDYLLLPPVPVDPSLPGQMQRWMVQDRGMLYERMMVNVSSFSQCDENGRDMICVKPHDTVVMGWNDIGTPFVVLDKNEMFVEGIYMGKDLYKPVSEVKYLTLYPYGQWLYRMVEKYKL